MPPDGNPAPFEPPPQASQKRGLVLILVAGCLLRALLAWYALRDPAIPREADDYIGIAQKWLSTGAYPTTLFPPGYPFLCRFLLQLSGRVEDAVTGLLVLQTLTGTLCIWLSAVLVRTAFRAGTVLPAAPLVAAALVALDPLLLQQGQLVLTESIYTVLLLGVGCLLLRMRQKIDDTGSAVGFALIGALLGVASLVRSVGVVSLPAMIFLIWTASVGAGRRVRMAMALCASFTLVLALWSWHNYREFGRFSVSSSGAYNVAALIVGPAKSMVEGKKAEANLDIWRDELRAELAAFDGRNGFRVADRASSVALSWALEHPLPVLKVNAKGQALILVGPGLATWSRLLGLEQGSPVRMLLAGAVSAFRALVFLLAAIGIYYLARYHPSDARTAIGLALLVSLHFLASGAGYSRFASPLVPYLDVIAAIGLVGLVDRLRHRRLLTA